MGTIGYAKNMCNKLLDLVYPQDLYCMCCGKVIDRSRIYRLCNECMQGIKWVGSETCVRCGKRLADINPGQICFNCREHPHQFRKGYTCTEYGTHERALVFRLKYDGRADIGDTLGEIMYDRMTAEYDPDELRSMYDLVIPVPVYGRKMRLRGYNQAALIARGFTDRAGLELREDIIIRAKETHMMRSLSPDERRENIRGAFALRPGSEKSLEDKRVLVIDDIYTTGATVDEIAAVLRAPWTDPEGSTKSGASRVDVLSFAAGADMVKGY